MDLIEIVEERNGVMSDFILIHNLRCIENLMSNTDNDIQKIDYSIRYIKGYVIEQFLEIEMGACIRADVAELEEHDFCNLL